MRVLLLCFLCLSFAVKAHADDAVVVHLELKDHAFSPAELDVPAGQKFKLLIKNDDTSAAEFESADLNREKVVPPGKEIAVFFDGLDAGTYGFYDDFRRDTVTGKIIAK